MSISAGLLLGLVALLPLQAPAHPGIESDAPRKAVVIPIHGPIHSILHTSLERRVTAAQDTGVDVIVFDFDTPGGEVLAMMEIADLISGLPAELRTVGYISGRALSAGAFIAFSCREFVMREGATIGDCEPIIMSPSGGIETAEKMQSPIRADFRRFAERNGYPIPLVEAMVSKELEVVEVRLRGEEEPRYVYGDDLKLWTEEERERIVSQRIVSKAGQLLTLTSNEALEFGLSKATVTGLEEVLERYDVSESAPILEVTWSEDVAAFLQSAGVRFVLLLLGILGIYMEFKTPGFGVFGVVGIAAFLLLFGSGYIAGLADVWEIVLFGLGVGLILLEIFVIPGFGVAGIAGILMVLASLYLTSLPFILPDSDAPRIYSFQVQALRDWFLHFTLSLAVVVVIIVMLSKYLPQVPLFNRLILKPEVAPSGSISISHGSAAPLPALAERSVRVGDHGVALTSLRPAGVARIGSTRYDVVTEGGFLDSGDPVTVLAVEGNRVLVGRRADA